MKGLTILHRVHPPMALVEAKRMAWLAVSVGQRPLKVSFSLTECTQSVDHKWGNLVWGDHKEKCPAESLCPTSQGG